MTDDKRSLGDIVGDVTSEFGTLVREEIALAKAEVQQTLSQAVGDVVAIVLGGFVAYTGLLVLIAAAVLGLATAIAPWLSALLIGIVLALVGAILLRRGIKDLGNLSSAPRTAETLKKDAAMVKEKLP